MLVIADDLHDATTFHRLAVRADHLTGICELLAALLIGAIICDDRIALVIVPGRDIFTLGRVVSAEPDPFDAVRAVSASQLAPHESIIENPLGGERAGDRFGRGFALLETLSGDLPSPDEWIQVLVLGDGAGMLGFG